MPDYDPEKAKEESEKAQDILASDGQSGGGEGVDLGGGNLVDLGKKASKKFGKKGTEEGAKEGAEEAGEEAGKKGAEESGKEGARAGEEEATKGIGKGATEKGAKDVGKSVAKEGAENVAEEIAKEGARETVKEGGKTATGAAAGVAPGMGTLATVSMEGADATNKAAQDAKLSTPGQGDGEGKSYAGKRAGDAVDAGINIAESAIADVAGAASDVVGAGPIVEPVVRGGLKVGEKITFGAGEAIGVSKTTQISGCLMACFMPLLIGAMIVPVVLGLTAFFITSNVPLAIGTPPPGGGGPAPPSSSASEIVNAAMSQLGKAYVWAAPGWDWSRMIPPPVGESNYDCSGLTGWAIYWGTGGSVSLPHYSGSQCTSSLGTKITSKSDLQPGDLVCFGSPIHHVGLYYDTNKYIHSPRTGDIIKVSDMGRSDFRWGVRFTAPSP